MRSLTPALAVALGLCLAAPAWSAPAVVLKLDAAAQSRLGVTTRPLAARRRGAATSGFARALDTSPLAALDADIATAAAAADASRAEAARTRDLAAADATVSKRAAEAAAAQAKGDAIKLGLLRRRLGLEWGPSLAAMSDARRGRLISDLAAGRATLVRIDAAGGVVGAGGVVDVDLGPAGVAHARVLGPARVSDTRLQAAGLLALVTGPQALRFGVGASAPATLAVGAASDGVVIPREALIRTGGQTFAYVRRDAGSFERRPVAGGLADPEGLFVASGFRPGEPVVIRGAMQLFAAEAPSKPEE